MKKIIVILLFIPTFNLNSSEFVKNDFRFKAMDNTSDEVTKATGDQSTSASNNNIVKGLHAANLVHAILGGVSYAGMVADCIIGNIILARLYSGSGGGNDDGESDSTTGASASADSSTGASQQVMTGLQTAHRWISISTYGLMGSAMIMSFVTLGIKIKNHMPINQFHFISSIITSVLYLLEIPFIAVSAYAYNTHSSYTKEITLAHGIYSYVLLASFTITLISIPIGYRHQKALN